MLNFKNYVSVKSANCQKCGGRMIAPKNCIRMLNGDYPIGTIHLSCFKELINEMSEFPTPSITEDDKKVVVN